MKVASVSPLVDDRAVDLLDEELPMAFWVGGCDNWV